jgi:hypothetical protein
MFGATEKESKMTSLLITTAILPGKLDVWRGFVQTLLGKRHDAYRAAIRDAGLSRLRVWHQRTPDGSDAAVVLFEGPAPQRFLERIATGADDFSAWFRAQLVEAHALDLSRPPPPAPELAIDERGAEGSGDRR